MILPLPPDGVVREPGAYRIPIAHYHTQAVCPGPSISSSGLRTIETQSPADYWAFAEMNTDRFDREPSDAMTFGRAAHALLLGDGTFRSNFAVVPDDAPPRPTKAQLKAAEAGRISKSAEERFAFWDRFDADNEGLEIIPQAWMEHIGFMVRSLEQHPLVKPLFEGESEVSLIWQDQTGIWLKARPDMLPYMDGVKADLKTCPDASLRAVTRDIRRYGYDMQAALGCIGCEVVLGQKITSDVMVFVQKSPPYHVTPIEITEDAIHWAKLRLRRAINTFARCMETGDWPWLEGIPQFGVKDIELDAYAHEQAAGTLPRSFNEPFGSIGGETPDA